MQIDTHVRYKHIYIYMREIPLGSICRFGFLYIYYINNSDNLHNLNGGLDLNYLNYFLGFK